MITAQQKIKDYFTDRRQRCLSVKSLEEEAGLPTKTLAHFLKDRRQLNDEAVSKLIPILKEFGYK